MGQFANAAIRFNRGKIIMTDLKNWQRFALGDSDEQRQGTPAEVALQQRETIPPRSYARRIPKELHHVVRNGHTGLGMRMLDQIRVYDVPSALLVDLRSQPQTRIKLNPDEQDIHDHLVSITGYPSIRIFICALLLARNSPLTPAAPESSSRRQRVVNLQAPERDRSADGKATSPEDLPFFVSSMPNCYPEQTVTFPFQAAMLFQAANPADLEEHIKTLQGYLRSDSISQDERDLLAVCLSIAQRIAPKSA
ncbi:MAG TPA: hypothetical protein DD390_12150 [Rhodospirillaceae bacterium]|nr:hypothetical protein [Rhodospirillaceae bacterium]MAX61947.1 hypothetical protein [Rhodospirillaceae bacterium]MAX63283.1 hypothetical protein [Rhodospirillaceae bacterium]HBM13439.1 hypothetical protein [Rhodospirillaceae bacterium]